MTEDSERERRVRLAANETLYRTVNEKLEDLNRALTFAGDDGTMTVVCECGDLNCAEQITMTVKAYEDVRADPTLFIVVSGHEIPDVEKVVRRSDGHTVVCKHMDPGRAIAEETDPRQGESGAE